MVKVVCTIVAIAIKDLEICLGNLNLFLGKNVIQFEPLTQIKETHK